MDIDTVDLVINADLPSDAATYVHRCGRTGRAGRSGLAVSLAGSRDGRRLENINRENNLALEPKPLPKAAINQVIKLYFSWKIYCNISNIMHQPCAP